MYIGGLDKHLSTEDIKEYVQKWGEIVKMTQPTDRKGRRKDFAFIEFKDAKSANMAVNDSGKT